MKRRPALRTLAALPLFAALPMEAARAAPAAPGAAVSWPAVKLLDGSRWAPPEGKAAVVVFWATHCPFCKRHNEHLEKLHQAARGKTLTVLTVARDRDPETVRRMMADKQWTFPVTLDYTALAAALSQRNMIPLTVTVSRSGKLQQVFPGEMFEEDLLDILRLAA